MMMMMMMMMMTTTTTTMVVVVVVVMMMKKNILRLQGWKIAEKLTVTKIINKFPVHKSLSLPTMNLSLNDPFQYYPPIYTYIFIS
jgi:hypothetical protein